MPDHDLTALAGALEDLARDDFILGPAWESVHEICQAHEGEMPYDAAHALCHRIEGGQLERRLLVSPREKASSAGRLCG